MNNGETGLCKIYGSQFFSAIVQLSKKALKSAI